MKSNTPNIIQRYAENPVPATIETVLNRLEELEEDWLKPIKH